MEPSGKIVVQCGKCAARMDVTQLAPFTRVECPDCGEPMRVKSEFGPYKLVRRHAVGGMSMVFAAHDATLDREVALKILNEECSRDETRIAAFEEEARITASFTHPNVVRVFKTGRAFGRFYIAMEMVPGGHLEEHIQELGKIPEAEMLQLAIEVARGLKAARKAGLIHRDVKPGNILLDANGHARLVDFGLALVTKGGKALASEIWATPYYVPPETIDGLPEDFRSDIYAFGSTLYHALGGRPPCDQDSMSTDALREAKRKITPLAKVDPAVSATTCRIVDRAMAHEPSGRYGSYDELIADLKKSLSTLKSGADPAERTMPARGQNRRAAPWIAAAAIVLVSVVAYAIRSGEKPSPEETTGTDETSRTPVAPVPGLVDHTAEIARIHREARTALETRDFAAARRGFGALLANEHVLEPTRGWAAVEAVLAAFLDGNATEARKMARRAHNHLAGLPADHPLAGGPLLELLAGVGDFAPLACPDDADSAAGVAAAMLAGLKNWEQGMLDAAAPCFMAAAEVSLSQDQKWIVFYQTLAAEYLSDHEILTSSLFTEEPADRVGCEAAIARLDEAAGRLKTRGRAPFNVRSWQQDLRHRALRFAALEAAGGQDPSGYETDHHHDPVLERVIGHLEQLVAACRFDEASAYVRGLAADPPGASRESLLALVEAAAVFPADLRRDLETEAHSGELKLKSGVTVVRLGLSENGKLTARSADGDDIICQWTDFSADSLIELHRLLVRKSGSEIERLRRHESAIAFDWLAGNRERALTAAANLSQGSPVFQQRWNQILAGLPQ